MVVGFHLKWLVLVLSFDKEIVKFVKQGGSKENMGLRFKELGCEVKGLGPGDVRF